MNAPLLTFHELLNLRRITDVDVSADGARVAFVVYDGAPAKGAKLQSRVWIGNTGGEPRAATRGPSRDVLPRFSPDGTKVAFTSDRNSPGLQGLYLLEFGGEEQSVGGVLGSIENIRWSQGGTHLLVLAADPGSDLAGGQTAKKIPAQGGVELDPIVRRPAQGWRRLYSVDLATDATEELGPDGVNVWEFGWSGEGDVVAIISDDPSERAWYTARVALLDVEHHSLRTLYEPQWQVQSPDISSDGRHVVFLEGLGSDRGCVVATATVVDVTSGVRHPLATDCDLSSVRWIGNDRLFGRGLRGLETMCVEIALDGTIHELWSGPATLTDASCSHDGRSVAAVKHSPQEPPELAVLEANAWRPLTRLNAALAERGVPTAERLAWRAPDDLEIEGILLRPLNRGRDPLPLVVMVHGGPSAAWTFTYNSGYFGLGVGFGNAGYAVLMPNPRGSTGRGQQFARANLGDLGGGELQDILEGVRALVAAGIVDPAQIGITGASHGGFLAAWATTQTDCFAAAAPLACVSNWISFHNTSNIPPYDELFLQSDPYDPTGHHFTRSPITQIRKSKTPTLILHGELDLSTPVGQAHELYQALVETGNETELVIYPREGHGWQEREHLTDSFQRILKWFERHFATRSMTPDRQN